MILKEAAEAFMQRPVDYFEVYKKAGELHDLFAPLSGVSAGNITDEDIMLPQGKAISPIKAAFCLKEAYRTAVFVSGIYQAIRSLQENFPGERIRILYAGCGPYATLLTPLTSMFSSEEVLFYLVDINPISLEAVKKLYEGLGLTDYVHSVSCIDAITYKMETPMHLVISETMLNGLATEPQVAIMLNLVPQLMEKALFIPQEIRVSAQLVDPGKEDRWMADPSLDPGRIHLGDLYTIGQKQCTPHKEIVLSIPEEINGNNKMVLHTDITVFKEEKLKLNDCSLNLPWKVMDVTEHTGKKIAFLYEISAKPKFNHTILD